MSRLTDYDPCGARSRPSGRFTCDRRPHPGDGPHQALVPDRVRGTYRVLTWDDDSGDVNLSPTLLAVPDAKRHKGRCSTCGRLCVCDSKATKAAARELLAELPAGWGAEHGRGSPLPPRLKRPHPDPIDALFCRGCGAGPAAPLYDGPKLSDGLCWACAEHAHAFDAAT